MADTQLIEEIKTRLGLTGDYQDALIGAYADDVKEFLVAGGIPYAVAESEKSIGVIARGVADLWNFGAGEGTFSPVFYQRLTQLRYEVSDDGQL